MSQLIDEILERLGQTRSLCRMSPLDCRCSATVASISSGGIVFNIRRHHAQIVSRVGQFPIVEIRFGLLTRTERRGIADFNVDRVVRVGMTRDGRGIRSKPGLFLVDFGVDGKRREGTARTGDVGLVGDGVLR
uniref:Uncharacterized protein n=1 Tax=Cacopsylla melanoneura TaxID=428564 RepID=A0A8D8V2S6_9HEMI